MNLIPRKYYLDDFFDDFKISNDSMLKCDIYEKEGIYNIEIDVPGFNKDDISIECKNGYLTIVAKNNNEEESSDKNYIRKERSYGEYTRSFYLGDVDTESINAKFNNGTLCIAVPKEDKKEDKTIIQITD